MERSCGIALRTMCLFLVVPAIGRAAAGDHCAALIPEHGAYQIIAADNSHVQFDTAREMYCSDSFSQYAQKNGWNLGVTIPVEGVPVSGSGSGNNESSSVTREQFCGNSSYDLTSTDKGALYRMQGDSTLAQAFVQCEKNAVPPGPLQLVATSKGATVTLTLTPSFPPSAYERVTGIAAAGAQPVEGGGIAAGTVLQNSSAVSGLYVLTAPNGSFVVRTTAGDKTVNVNKCLDGSAAGSYVASWTTTLMQPQSSPISWTQGVPQAHCHPHCHTSGSAAEIGDEYSFTFHAPAGGTLSSPSWTCQGGGCPFEDEISFSQPDSATLVFHIRSRSEAVNAIISATSTVMNPQTQSGSSNGAVNYAEAFSVLVPAGAKNASLTLAGLSVPLNSGMATGPWNSTQLVVLDGGTPSGGNTSYGFKLTGPSCTSDA